MSDPAPSPARPSALDTADLSALGAPERLLPERTIPLSRSGPFRAGFLLVLGGALGLLAVYSVYAVREVLVTLSLAAFIALGIDPIVGRLTRRGIPRGRAAGLVLGLGGALLVGFGYLFFPPLISQITEFIASVPGIASDLADQRQIQRLTERFPLLGQALSEVSANEAQIKEFSGRALSGVLGGALGAGQAAFAILIDLLTITVLALYFTLNLDRIKATGLELVSASRRQRTSDLLDSWLAKVGAYVVGVFCIAGIAAAASFVVLSLLGVPYAAALAAVVFITGLVPLVGNLIGAFVCLSVALFVSPKVFLIALVYFLVYNQVENFLIAPRINSRSVELPGVASLIAVLIGATLLGVPGALLAIPVAALIDLLRVELITPTQDKR